MEANRSTTIERYFHEIKRQFSCKETREILGTRYEISGEKGGGSILRLHIDGNIDMGIFQISSEYKYYFNSSKDSDLLIISYCLQGNKEIVYDKRHRIKKGDIVYFRPSKKYSCHFLNYESICFIVDLDSIKDILAKYKCEKYLFKWNRYIDSICKQDDIVIESAPNFVSTLANETKGIEITNFFDYIKFKEMILNHFRYFLRLRENRCCLLNKNRDDMKYVWEAEKIIMNNLENELLIQDLADRLDISTYKLQKIFKETKGTTVYDFIRKTKIDESKLLLKDTDWPIICIAHNLGYENPSKFSSAFKDIVGLTPTEYRRRFRKRHRL